MPGLLTEADLADVQRALWDGRAKWYNLGLELGLKAGTLDAIQLTNANNVDNCFRSMLKEWLRKTELVPTWSSLARALREQPVGLGELAQRLPV
ncbi:MAG: death domain-containing protein [Proteobacteria bacterium]|nr:death domain-containing protein [Pseudomonadota bacterium]